MYRGISVADIPENDIVSAKSHDLEAQRFLPLTLVEFHILAALSDQPRHGYGIMQEVEVRSEGKLKIGAGTLYGALKRMLADELVYEDDDTSDSTAAERRRYYGLTPLGLVVVRADSLRLAKLVQYARSKALVRPRTV
jgi:DNA-binding PadR family transcriptional regulator